LNVILALDRPGLFIGVFMDIGTIQALVGLLTLIVLVVSGVAFYLSSSLISTKDKLQELQVDVAKNYVTKDEHENYVTKEINGLKELILRIESYIKDEKPNKANSNA
tara:strand:+ start:5996 stop:6316 length:321 start_codon:yes stop_codon:yes gene_type:complete